MVVRAASGIEEKISRKAEKKRENGSVDLGHPIEALFAKVHFAKLSTLFSKKPRLRGLGISYHGGTYCIDFRA